MNDLRFAFRQLLKNPGFTAVAHLALALGIGANAIILASINPILFKAGHGATAGATRQFLSTRSGWAKFRPVARLFVPGLIEVTTS
ncbi:MAG TPA: hypothetical protein VMB21_08355 [Candidatus Limnocylindria bacterium]|jgi:hypothetical protein|nr:hypothetical protein [Candidatus Limnocylindria bacterium]